ncbi:hypothetical protein [Gordoniibacillus kamchatkensis]|uniref:hypothetical protein n=1 Tax=Gordoniibacillus kamchatkensis TaxID=1590651 RepID=UPI000697C2C0|nr:hypothetical protein [Paenibacillus sp. VKM B-2647]
MIRSIQIDPAFPYYRSRSPESVAEELKLAGYGTVHIFVTNECAVDRTLVMALRRQDIEVWALTLGNGTFVTSHLPTGWQQWRMGLLKKVDDGYTRLSPFCREYVAWKKQALARLVATVPFDGLEIAEPYLPEWNGLESGTYGDIGPHAQREFEREYGAAIPDLRDPSAPTYYAKQPELYGKWVEFRVRGVNRYVAEMINGAGGVREARPGIRIATWTLAIDAGPDSLAKLRELQGNDAVSMARAVKPDVHYLQTHWPDWGRADLPPSYVRGYKPFIESLRAANPQLPIGIQTDIGSAKRMIRSRAWLDSFEQEVRLLGCETWTAYEYQLGGALYDEAPRLLWAVKFGTDSAVLSFHKRISKPDAMTLRFAVRTGSRVLELQPSRLHTDGNRLFLYGVKLPEHSCELGVQGVCDTPELLHFPPAKTNRCDAYQWIFLA